MTPNEQANDQKWKAGKWAKVIGELSGASQSLAVAWLGCGREIVHAGKPIGGDTTDVWRERANEQLRAAHESTCQVHMLVKTVFGDDGFDGKSVSDAVTEIAAIKAKASRLDELREALQSVVIRSSGGKVGGDVTVIQGVCISGLLIAIRDEVTQDR